MGSTNITINETFNDIHMKSEHMLSSINNLRNKHDEDINLDRKQLENINEKLKSLHDNSGTKEDLNIIIKTNEQAIDQLKKNFDENINSIMTANITINENFNGLHVKSEEINKNLEDLKSKQGEDVDDLKKNIASNRSMIDDLNEEIKDVKDKASNNSTVIQNFQDNCFKNFESIETRLISLNEMNRDNADKII